MAGLDHPEGQRADGEDRRDLAGEVERGAPAGRPRPVRVRDQRRDPHRDVEEEDRPPVDRARQHPADDRPGRERDPADRRPDPDRLGPLAGIGVGEAHERKRGGEEQRGRHALEKARDQQQLERGRRAADDRRERERHHPDRVAARDPDPVGERAGRQQQRRERDDVRVDHPLQLAQVGAEVVADRGQGDVDDRHVEDDDEEPERGCEQDPAWRGGRHPWGRLAADGDDRGERPRRGRRREADERPGPRRQAGRPRARRTAASRSCSPSPAATCSRSTTAASPRGSTSSTPATSRRRPGRPRGTRRRPARPGVAALTAGPGVTNGMSAMAGAKFNRSPLVVLGGRAPRDALGLGLAPGDRPPAVRLAADQVGRDGQGDRRDRRRDRARDRHRAARSPTGPTYVDYPLDVVFMEGEGEVRAEADRSRRPRPRRARGGRRGARRRRAPGDHGRHRRLLVARRGRARSSSPRRSGSRCSSTAWAGAACPPTTSSASRRARGQGLKEADVALVVGVPLDFRLGFGGSLRRGDEADLARRVAERADRQPQARPRAGRRDRGDAGGAARGGGVAPAPRATAPTAWVASLRETEDEKRAGEAGGARRRPRPASPAARSTASSPRCSTATRS